LVQPFIINEGFIGDNSVANYEIVNFSGGLSYLFFDKSLLDSLLGTTLYIDNYPLEISNQNNELEFNW